MGNEVLEVTTKIGCSNMCEYCPQTTLIKRYRDRSDKFGKQENKSRKRDKLMSLETFVKCISTIPLNVDIHFTGYVEPFLNPDTIYMIIHAAKKGHRIMVNTTLVGLKPSHWDVLHKSFAPFKLNDSDEQYMQPAIFKGIHIHLPSASYSENIGVQIPFKYIASGQKALSKKYESILRHVMTKHIHGTYYHCHGDLHPQLESAKDIVKALTGEEIIVREINSRAMNLLLTKKEKVPEEINIRGKCPRVYQNVLLPDGTLALCCQDYGLDQIMGNLKEQTWTEYRNSDLFKKIAVNGADICDYCEEEISYVDKSKWSEWRRPTMVK